MVRVLRPLRSVQRQRVYMYSSMCVRVRGARSRGCGECGSAVRDFACDASLEAVPLREGLQVGVGRATYAGYECECSPADSA